MLHYLCQQICSVDADLKIFNNPLWHLWQDLTSKIWNTVSPLWFSDCQPKKFLYLIIVYDKNLITINLLNMYLWITRVSPR